MRLPGPTGFPGPDCRSGFASTSRPTSSPRSCGTQPRRNKPRADSAVDALSGPAKVGARHEKPAAPILDLLVDPYGRWRQRWSWPGRWSSRCRGNDRLRYSQGSRQRPGSSPRPGTGAGGPGPAGRTRHGAGTPLIVDFALEATGRPPWPAPQCAAGPTRLSQAPAPVAAIGTCPACRVVGPWCVRSLVPAGLGQCLYRVLPRGSKGGRNDRSTGTSGLLSAEFRCIS